MKKAYVVPKKVKEEVRKANVGVCGLFNTCGELVKNS